MPEINNLSKHLFWDVDSLTLDAELHKKFIVKRVLEYGLLNDWIVINKYYGKDKIAQIAASLRSLDPKALSFISTYSGLAKENFRCFTTPQSTQRHWSF